MPFRERLKKTFSRNSQSGTASEDSSTTSGSDGKMSSNVYLPGEKIPQKYRRPVEKAHKEKLESFSFANAWRRKSYQSVYSPMGSRMPSRKNSAEVQTGRRSLTVRRGDSYVGKVAESEHDELDVGNVGLSRQPTADRPKSKQDENGHLLPDKAHDYGKPRVAKINGVHHNPPFSQEDLTLAMKRSHLDVPS